MLDELSVANLGIIGQARIEPGPGLVVVSGETGAGKTLLFGALQLLLGMPARSGMVGPESDEALVEGRFIADGEEVVVSRRLAKAGRSRSYLNGAMAPLTSIGEATSGIVEVVAQHDQLSITRTAEIRRMIDRLLDEEGLSAAAAYLDLWDQYEQLRSLREELGGDARALERERALAEWQANEIADAGFGEGEDAQIESTLRKLRGAAELHLLLGEARASLEGAVDQLGAARSFLQKAARVDDDLASAVSALGDSLEMVADLTRDIRDRADGAEADPEVLEKAERRMALLGDLRRKYGDTLAEVLQFGEQADKRAAELEVLSTKASSLDGDESALVNQLEATGETLRFARRRSGVTLAEATADHLRDLGFSEPVVEVSVESRDPQRTGADHVSLLFASDARLEPGPVAKVASGGELSRLVLALRLAGGAGNAPVIAFDEIDAGVGGKTGLALGKKLAALARTQQVLAVTHLPQLAAFADAHYVVERDGPNATTRLLGDEDRAGELSRMLAGLDESSQGQQHAAELLRMARELGQHL